MKALGKGSIASIVRIGLQIAWMVPNDYKNAIAAINYGEPVVIPNAEGGRTTPSVVGLAKDGERLVGRVQLEARRAHRVRAAREPLEGHRRIEQAVGVPAPEGREHGRLVAPRIGVRRARSRCRPVEEQLRTLERISAHDGVGARIEKVHRRWGNFATLSARTAASSEGVFDSLNLLTEAARSSCC